jgi:hypothetical protein
MESQACASILLVACAEAEGSHVCVNTDEVVGSEGMTDVGLHVLTACRLKLLAVQVTPE